MTPETKALLTAEGALTHAHANSPFLLVNPGDVWLVVEGRVDVFAVDLADGERGPRKHMFSVEADEMLWGVEAGGSGGYGLLAVAGLNTRVAALARSRLIELAADEPLGTEIGALIDQYVRRLSSSIARHGHPRFQVALSEAEAFELSPGEIAGAQEETVWVRHNHGTSVFVRVDGLSLADGELFLPVTEGTWLESPGGAGLTIVDTAAWLERDPEWRGFDAFQRLFVRWLAYDCEQGRAAERRRLDSRVRSDQELKETALGDLATLMETETVDGPEERDDPLLAACQAIGRVSGIDFKPVPYRQNTKDNADRLRAICEVSAVGSRRVILRDRWWETDSGPLLCFTADTDTQSGNAVTALPTRPGRYELWNPVDRSRIPIDQKVAAGLQSVAYEFYRPLPNRVIGLADLGLYALRDMKADFRSIVLLGAAGVLLGMVTPIVTAYLFNSVIPNANLKQVGLLFVALVAVALTSSVFLFVRNIALLRAETRSSSNLQMAMVDRAIRLPLPFFRQYAAGDLAERLTGVNAVRQILGGATISLILSSLTSAGGFLLLFYYSPTLALVAVGVLGVSTGFVGVFSWKALHYDRQLHDVSGRLSGLVLQLLGGVAKLRVSASETRAFAVWAGLFRAQKQYAFKSGQWGNRVTVYNSVASLVSSLVLFGIAGSIDAGSGRGLATGDFLAFYAAFGAFIAAGTTLSETFVDLLRVIPLTERARPVLDAVPEIAPNLPDPGELHRRIEFNHVSFRYHPDSPLVIDDLSFQVDAGEFVALVGPSGSGKSTILRLLLGLETPESGSIYYDGQEIRSVDAGAVRRQIGVVLQSGRLFSGDMLSNIIGSSSLTIDDAWEAARLAGLEETIRQLPMGMGTVLNEGGTTLSGGQRQRLLIARALVRKPRIVFFDEATSALDARTQSLVAGNLEQLHATRIVVAHRLSTIRNANRILVIDRGRLVQSDTYDALLKQPGLFADLVRRELA